VTASLLRHIDVKRLRQLIEIADKGSIRAAADSLAITQPALRRSVRALEAELGVKLVERGPRGAELTPIGDRLLKYARIIEANLTLAEKELRGLRDASERSERIAFGMSWLTEAIIAAPLVARVLRGRPGLHLAATVGDYEALAPKLMSGSLEFFIGPPPVESPAAGIATEPLGDFRAVAVVRAAHPLAGREDVGIGNLLHARWVLPSAGTIPRTTYDNAFLRHGAAPPEPVFEVQPLSPAIRQLIMQADLVTILPFAFIQPEIEAGLLCALRFDSRIVFPIHLTCRQMSYPSPARDYLLEEIKRIFAGLKRA
jgi:DNA-binding transcriptional LysR family regulator